MPFRLIETDSDLTAMLRRIAQEMLQRTVDAPGGSVHEARKRVKKMRAVLRLVRPGMKTAKAANAALRDAAAGLSAMRDAEVMLAVHDRLGGEATGWLRTTLEKRLEAARAGSDGGAAFRAALAPVAAASVRWRVKGADDAVLAEGLATTRRRGQRAMAMARAEGTPEAMHEWRKQVKAVWYQARLLAPVWPEAMAPVVDAADRLGEVLGDHHDLAVFRLMIEAMPEAEAPATEVLALRAAARRQMATIEAEAFPAGARLLAGPPEAMAALWTDWWRLWRKR